MANEVTVTVGAQPFTTTVTSGRHQLTADEPGDLGGHDEGPAPTSLLLASIATCKVITAKMYADRKGWPVERIDATARAAAVAGHVISRVEVELTVTGDLTDDQRQRVLEIAEKCPVQKAVSTGIVVASKLAPA
ncbi:MAG: OsmC family protein [Planctomycetota bacterium]|nr:MAG: OsmC family protein [Planctomycetota bacterium]